MGKFINILILIGGFVIIGGAVTPIVNTLYMTVGCTTWIAAFVLFINELWKI